MKTSITWCAGLFAIAFTGSLPAASLVITSPDHGETLSDSSMTNQGLHWNARSQRLTAIITFSNANYDSDIEPLHSDTLRFTLPGIQYDQAENMFYAASKNGERTPIAKFNASLFGKVIRLVPGATVYVEKNGGLISIKVVKALPGNAPHWKLIHSPDPQS